MEISPLKPDRSRIDLSSEALTRSWAKKLGVSTTELVKLVEKVGDKVETVRKELAAATAKNEQTSSAAKPLDHNAEAAERLPLIEGEKP